MSDLRMNQSNLFHLRKNIANHTLLLLLGLILGNTSFKYSKIGITLCS